MRPLLAHAGDAGDPSGTGPFRTWGDQDDESDGDERSDELAGVLTHVEFSFERMGIGLAQFRTKCPFSSDSYEIGPIAP